MVRREPPSDPHVLWHPLRCLPDSHGRWRRRFEDLSKPLFLGQLPLEPSDPPVQLKLLGEVAQRGEQDAREG